MLACVALPLFSCTDSGCIDADDFGEYETQTITIPANASSENCTYDSSLAITDSSQGPGIKACLTQGSTTVYDETGASVSSTTGCYGITDPKFQNICVNNCVQSCLSSVGSSNSASAEPTWISTDKKGSSQNSGVTIRPGSQIIVRATGSISLGSSVTYPDLFVNATNPKPHSNNSSWQSNFFDARNGQSLGLNFSGLVYLNGALEPTGEVYNGGTLDSTALYNLSRKLVMYTIPHPEGYGGFDLTATTEKSGVKVTPLLPDSQAWQCSYSGADLLDATCGNSSYYSLGYVLVTDGLANNAFPLSAASKTSTLTQYGGVIRWANDGLKNSSYDPFTENSVTCDGTTGVCSNINSVPGDKGIILGDLSSGSVVIQNSYTDAFKVSFRSLTTDSGCDSSTLAGAGLNVDILDSSGNTLYPATSGSTSQMQIVNSSWTSATISLEPGQKLKIDQSAVMNYNGTGVNCGRVIGVRFLKYHDLTMEQSGYVRFSILGAGAGSTCTIKGRIINPNGKHTASSPYTADFYEYGTFYSPTQDVLPAPDGTYDDPMYLMINTPVGTGWTPGTGSSAQQVFVRKGQKIRFDPDSWNSTWTTSTALTRQCGIGMAMTIDLRPALLCRGTTTEPMSNPLCSPEVGTDGKLLGCQEAASECSDSSNSTYYCTFTECLDTITCPTDGISPYYQKTCNNLPSDADRKYRSSACTSIIANAYTGGNEATDEANAKTRCKQCSEKVLSNARSAAMLDVSGISQCYDLENYTGKVANLPSSYSGISDVESFLSGSNAKGAVKLNGFNGSYGNVGGFTYSGTSSYGKKVYQASSQYIVGTNSRVAMLLIDGGNFFNAWGEYANNTANTGNYSGTNGIKVGFTGNLEYKNGQWLQAQLCQETSNDSGNPSYVCKSTSPPNFATSNNQPQVVNIATPSPSAPVGSDPTMTGNYAFDSSGNLYRYNANSVTGDCTLAIHGYQNSQGSTFYCHTYQYFSTLDFDAKSESDQNSINSDIEKLRLTFKILDPETPTCKLKTSSAANDGIPLTNPFYDSGTPSNIGATCIDDDNSSTTSDLPGDGTTSHPGTCEKQFYCANKYTNNSGEYYVQVKVKSTQNDMISGIISAVVTPVIEVMDGKRDNPTTVEDEATVGQAERIYKLLIADPRYKAILTASLVVMFTFWGVGYLLGVSNLNHSEIIGRIMKIAFIYLMVGETGWDWFKMFFVAFFKEGTDYLSFMMASSFDESPDITNAIESGDLYDKSVLFSSVDTVFNLFFSSAVQKKISALLFASIFGWAYLLIIWWSFLHYVLAIGNAVLLYLTAQVFISIMFVLGPLFFVFIIFEQTKGMFENWLKQLIGFSLQQIFLLITLAFFNMLMYEVLKMSLGYKVCWDEVWVMNLGITRISLMSFWTIASLPPRTNVNSEVGNIGNPEGIPSIFTILFIWVIASLMQQFIGFMTDLASSISGGLKASEMGKGISDMAEKFNKSVLQPAANYAWDKTAGRAMDYADDKLFDSGKTADARRESADKKLATDTANKNAMLQAGKEAASKARKDNAGKSDAERTKAAAEASEKAMTEKAEKLGLSKEQTKALMNDKGIKTGGARTVAGAMRNAIKSRGTANQSLADQAKATSGKLTAGEAKEAMKGMSSDERKAFVEKQAKGEISVGKTALRTAADIASLNKSGRESIASAGKSAVKGLGSAMNAAASATVKMTTGMDVNVAQSLGEASGMDEGYNEAEQQMVREGALSEHGMRSKEEKEQIRERASKNAAEKAVPETSAPDESVTLDLMREMEHLEAMEKIDDEDTSGVIKGIKKMAKKVETAANRVNPVDPTRAAMKKEAGKLQVDRADGLDKEMEGAIEKNDQEITNLNNKREEAMGVVRDAGGKVANRKEKIENLRKDYTAQKAQAKKSGSEGDKKKAGETFAKLRQEERALEASDEYKAHQSASVAVHQIDAQIENREAKGATMKGIRQNISEARQIRSEAKAAAVVTDPKAASRSAEHQELAKSNPELMAKAGRAHDDILANAEKYGDVESAVENLEKYNEAIASKDVGKIEAFVKEHYQPSAQEKLSSEIESQYKELGSSKDFEQFVKKYGDKK